MKRRNFLKGLVVAPAVAPALLKEKKEGKVIGQVVELTGPPKKTEATLPPFLTKDPNRPREGDRRLLPLESITMRGGTLVGNEESPRYEKFKNGRWIRND